MDCSNKYGNKGCQGGLMDNAFKYIVGNHGLDSEKDYDYKGMNGNCSSDRASRVVATIDSFADVPASNEAQLAAAVNKGPVSVAIEADQSCFQSYKSGVFDSACGTKLDHGVLVVGYTADAYIVKNSVCVLSCHCRMPVIDSAACLLTQRLIHSIRQFYCSYSGARSLVD